MKIAAIVICYNDEYKLKEWIENYQNYKESIYKLIIVDNGSKQEFLSDVKESFKEAKIIERKQNDGIVMAYNDGIREALTDSLVDSIMLIGNDVKIEKESVDRIYQTLFAADDVGMVAPVLLEKDSNIVSDAGSSISYCFYMKPKDVGVNYHDLDKKSFYVDSLTGGMNLAKRKFYENVGLQDEKLFMYSDEVDMGTRAKKKGFKMVIARDAVAWHQHINKPGRERRLPFCDYLMARNKVYLGRKFYGVIRAFNIWCVISGKTVLRYMKAVLMRRDTEPEKYALRGALAGLKGNMIIPGDMELY